MGDLSKPQDSMRDKIARSHAEKVAETQNEIRKARKKCDCTLDIRWSGKKVSLQVHYAVVSAKSEYCRSNSRCRMRRWRVSVNLIRWSDQPKIMKKALEQCIEFMYIGKAEIRHDTAAAITIISHQLQLKPLEHMGLEAMHDNLTTHDNCKALLLVARNCERREYEAKAIKKWISRNLQQMPELNECSSENLWMSTADLFQNSQDFRCLCKMLDVLKVLEIEKADCEFLLNVVMTTEKVAKDSVAAKHIFETICQKIDREPSNLNIGNYYKIKNLLARFESNEKSGLKIRLEKFMIGNFDDLVQKDGFLETNQDEVTSIFLSPQLTCTEKTKFNYMVRWVSHKAERAEIFPQLFKLIKLNKLSKKDLSDIKRNPLVDIKDSMLSSVFDAYESKDKKASDQPVINARNSPLIGRQESDSSSNESSNSVRSGSSENSRRSSSSKISFSSASLREDMISPVTSLDGVANVNDTGYYSPW